LPLQQETAFGRFFVAGRNAPTEIGVKSRWPEFPTGLQ
jgi:hypothetical protein